jgi:hypothetical protein
MAPSNAVKAPGTENGSNSTVLGGPQRPILRRIGIAIALVVSGLAACADPPEGSSGGSPSDTPNPAVTFALDGCPVPDEAFCETALVAVNGIAAGDAEALVAVSRPDEFDCGGIQSDFFPGCETDDVLEGYTFWTGLFPMWRIEVLSKADYLGRLEAMFAAVDASYVDEHGDGAPRVLGVKKCGGSWTITWTVAISDAGAPAERMGALLEFTVPDLGSEEWGTNGLVLLPLAYPETGYDEGEPSLDEIGCDDSTLPWG